MFSLNLKRQIFFWLQGANYAKSTFFNRNFTISNFIKPFQLINSYPSGYYSKNFGNNVSSTLEIKNEIFVNKIISKFSFEHEDDIMKYKFLDKNVINYIQKSIKQIRFFENEIKNLEIAIRDESDSKIKELMKEEIDDINGKISHLKESFFSELVENVSFHQIDELYLEINAGIGGQEAMLFAQNLMHMYDGYCSLNGWSTEALSYDETPLGGIRHVCMLIKGQNSYSKLKFEGGIHRVQRVPKTEKGGRIHTSTASVAILPVPSEINVKIEDRDLKIDFTRASGPGGQNVNKSNSAVRMTHLPTGIVVECQVLKTQEGNKKEALRKLKAKLYEIEMEKLHSDVSFQRKLQIGTKARSEKIRTYNFMQDRVTDHRVGISIHDIENVMAGGSSLEKLATELMKIGKLEKLKEILNISEC